MNGLAADRAGDDLHRIALRGAPVADRDAVESGIAGGEEGGVPAKEAFCGQGGGGVAGGVEEEVGQPPLGRGLGGEAAVGKAEAARQGGAQALAVAALPLDRRGLARLLDQGFELGRQTEIEAVVLQLLVELAGELVTTPQRRGQTSGIVAEIGPLRLLPDPARHLQLLLYQNMIRLCRRIVSGAT